VRALLISNSTQFGRGYLDHCAEAILLALGPAIRRVLFVPYAVSDRDRYAASMRTRFVQLGYELDSIHEAPGGPAAAIERADAIFIGGGNTFRLIDALWRERLIEPLRRRIAAGAPYLGASAGSNVACPTIRTTNDMPIVQPPSFEALGLVPFQINPHYQETPAGSRHMGETRDQRIAEFHEENDVPVLGLREGAWLDVDGPTIALGGSTGARLFRRGQPAVELPAGSRLDFRLDSVAAG
jgi:dipeptidase E